MNSRPVPGDSHRVDGAVARRTGHDWGPGANVQFPMLTARTPELLHLVGYLTGATLYAMLFAMVARAETARRPAGLATAMLGLVWNVGELLAARGQRLGD